MSLALYGDPDYPDARYPLSTDPEDSIKLIIVLKNISGWPLNIDRGLSQIELPTTLILTDPCGTTHELGPEAGEFAFDAPPPLSVGGRPVSPAEVLPPDFVVSSTVADLRKLFPVLRRVAGLYTLRAELQFTIFKWAFRDVGLGLIGVEDYPGNWSGTLRSEEMEIYVSPDSGAHARIQLLDAGSKPPNPLFHVRTKVFKTSDIPAETSLSSVWSNIEPLLTGITDDKGWVDWALCEACVPEDDYLVVAYYKNEYGTTSFETGEPGWAVGCTGLMEKQIVFGALPEEEKFSVFAKNSVWIQALAVIFSGSVGAPYESEGPSLAKGADVLIGARAEAKEGVKIYGNRVVIMPRAAVDDIYCNKLVNYGTVNGEEFPLEPPAWQEPPFHECQPGKKNVTVRKNKSKKLDPGSYGKIKVKTKGTLKLSGGIYHFRSLKLDNRSSLICFGPTEIRIKGDWDSAAKAYTGPTTDNHLSAKDVIFYVEGEAKKRGKRRSEPKVVVIGVRNDIKANIFAPYGTIWVGADSDVTGSLIAKDVIVGVNAKIRMESAF